MAPSSIAKFPNLDSVKRTISNYKKFSQAVATQNVLQKYSSSQIQNDTQTGFLLNDSAQTWYAEGTFKADPEYFFKLHTMHGGGMVLFSPVCMPSCLIKVNIPIICLENFRNSARLKHYEYYG